MSPNIICACFLVVLLSSCAIGPSSVDISHSALIHPPAKRNGTIAVKEFRDTRTDCEPTQVGNKRNGFGMVLGSYHTKDGKTVASAVTQHFIDALRQAGYSATLVGHNSTAPKGSAIVDGEIHEFWLDLYTAVWHNVGVKVNLWDRSGKRKLWEKDFNSRETNVLWLGLNSEIEKVVRQAIDKALNQAVTEFASEPFASRVSR